MKLIVALLALAAAIALAVMAFRSETVPDPGGFTPPAAPPDEVGERSANLPPVRPETDEASVPPEIEGRVPLRGTALLARIEGRVTLRGAGVAGRDVVLTRSDGTRMTTLAGADGRFAFSVVPSRVTVGVESIYDASPGWAVHIAPKSPWSRQYHLDASREIEALAGTNRCDLALPDGAIVVTVRGAADGLPLASAGIAAIYQTNAPRRATTDSGGIAVLDELAPGLWVILVDGEYCDLSLLKATRVLAGSSPVELTIEVDVMGRIEAQLVDERGSALEMSAALALEVRRVADDAVIHASDGNQRNQGPRPKPLAYGPIPAGSYLVQLADESATVDSGRAWRFQPVDAIAPVIAEVFLRKTTTVSLSTRYRAYVRIFVRDAVGEVDCSSPLVVRCLDPAFAGARALPGPWMTSARHNDAAFDGYLAPGTYLLIVQVGERTHSEHLTIGRSPIEHEIRLPF